MEEIEIPSYFVCPISLEMMRDPVTLTSGITFDRNSIERWIFSTTPPRSTCPVSKKKLPTPLEFTQNHTLRRLIQSWCVANNSPRIPTPRPQLNPTQISTLLHQSKLSTSPLPFLNQLHQLISHAETNRRSIQSSQPVLDHLASIIASSDPDHDDHADQTLAILHSLNIPDHNFLLIIKHNPHFLNSLFQFLKPINSNQISRAIATSLLKTVIPLLSPTILNAIEEEDLRGIVTVVGDRISSRATKAGLEVLIELVRWGGIRGRAVRAGVVGAFVEILIEDSERRMWELALVGIDKVCGCAEGRAALVGHGAGVAAVGQKLMWVSGVGRERAVRIVEKIARLSGSRAVVEELVELGVVNNLCLFMKGDYGVKEKERVRGILKLHERIWRNSPCLSPHFLSLYPG